MPVKSRFHRLDAFTKTVEDARIRTTSGGIVTLTSLILIIILALNEWFDYRKVLVQPELVVDKGRGTYFPLNHLACPSVPLRRQHSPTILTYYL